MLEDKGKINNDFKRACLDLSADPALICGLLRSLSLKLFSYGLHRVGLKGHQLQVGRLSIAFVFTGRQDI